MTGQIDFCNLLTGTQCIFLTNNLLKITFFVSETVLDTEVLSLNTTCETLLILWSYILVHHKTFTVI